MAPAASTATQSSSGRYGGVVIRRAYAAPLTLDVPPGGDQAARWQAARASASPGATPGLPADGIRPGAADADAAGRRLRIP